MNSAIVISLLLIIISVVVHSAGLSWLLDVATNQQLIPHHLHRRSQKVRLLIFVFAVLVCLHMTETAIWAGAYQAHACFDSFESSFYFSITTYTTLGSGDLQLPRQWQIAGALESMLGVLMFGWSSGFVVLVLSKIHAEAGLSLWRNAPDQSDGGA